jgi:flagella basal body P-ring formation protein FlgA
VIDAVRPHGLVFVNTRGLSDVTVTRASRALAPKDIESQIARAIAEQHGFADAKSLLVTFDRETRAIQLDPSASVELRVARLWYDARSAKFDISFEVPASGSTRPGAARYTGTIVETVEAAVVTRAFGRSEVIKAGDVGIERRPKAEAGSDVVGETQRVVGLAARRPLRLGQALRAADLMKPEVVQRNEAVTLIYEVPGMTLTFRGKAIDAGAEGDLVNVLNSQSKRTIQGTVAGPGRVIITSIAPAPTSLAAASQPEPNIMP